MIRPQPALAHALDDLAGHVEDRVHVDPDHLDHCSGVILWNMPSRVMPALLTSTSMGPSSAVDRLDRAAAVLEAADIALHHHDAELRGAGLGRLLVAGIAGGDLEAVGLQPLDDRTADAAGPARHQRYSAHQVASSL